MPGSVPPIRGDVITEPVVEANSTTPASAGVAPAAPVGEGDSRPDPAVISSLAPAGTEGGEAPEGETKPVVEPAKAPQLDWRERRLNTVTGKLREAEEELARLRAGATTAPQATPDEQQRINEAAAQRVAADEFNRACNDVAAKGKLAYTDFDSKVSSLVQLVDARDPASISQYNLFLSAAIETGDAPALLHTLGGDLNEAARILALPPVKMAVELTRLAAKAPAAVSNAPKPITPISNRGTTHSAIDPADANRADGLDTREWMRRREEQISKRVQR